MYGTIVWGLAFDIELQWVDEPQTVGNNIEYESNWDNSSFK